MKRIHVTSYGPRTGTTLMTEMMIACFDIDLFNEHENTVLKKPRHTAKVYLTKNPAELRKANIMLHVMSDLYVIFMLRDPRDAIVSKHNNDPDRYWGNLRFWKRFVNMNCIARLQKHPRFIMVRYEDLVTEPDCVQCILMERMPFLAKTADFSEYHKISCPSEKSVTALNGVRAPSTESIGKWKQHLPRVAGQLARHGPITEELITFGYEKDDKWLRCLAGIEPDMSPGYLFDVVPENRKRRTGWLLPRAIWAAINHYQFMITARSFLRALRKNRR